MASAYYLNVFRDLSRERTHYKTTGNRITARHTETSHVKRDDCLEEIIDQNGYAGLSYLHTIHVTDDDKAEVLNLLGEACERVHQQASEFRDECRLKGYVMSGVV